MIWRSRWVTETGIIECREALAFPGEVHRAVLLRRIIAVQGSAQVHVILEPAAEFGRRHVSHLHQDGECWHGQVGDLRMRWAGGAGADVRGDRVRSLQVTLTVPEGHHHDLILELSDTQLDSQPPDAGRMWEATATAWPEACPSSATVSLPAMLATPTRCCAG